MLFFPLLIAIAVSLVGCSTSPPSGADREALADDTAAALKQMYAQDNTLAPFLQNAAGYAVFPSVGKGAIGVGGAYGRGQVYQRGQFIGYADISQATIGIQIGGQSYGEVLAFEDAPSLSAFESGQFEFAATGSVVLIKAGAGGSARYEDGVSVFVYPVGGLMLEGAIGAQSFTYQPK